MHCGRHMLCTPWGPLPHSNSHCSSDSCCTPAHLDHSAMDKRARDRFTRPVLARPGLARLTNLSPHNPTQAADGYLSHVLQSYCLALSCYQGLAHAIFWGMRASLLPRIQVHWLLRSRQGPTVEAELERPVGFLPAASKATGQMDRGSHEDCGSGSYNRRVHKCKSP